jgi:tetrahydromethanopterin S-methyltransferase subunit A
MTELLCADDSQQSTEPLADVGVCVVGRPNLLDRLPWHRRIARADLLATANIGIEHLIVGRLGQPAITHIVVFGHDPTLFRPGQSLLALARNGVDEQGQIVGAAGYEARLPTLDQDLVAEFRRRVRVHDLLGSDSPRSLLATLPSLAAAAVDGFEPDKFGAALRAYDSNLVRLPAHGRRISAGLTGNGYFVVSIERADQQIVLRHYRESLTSGSLLRAHNAEALLLAAIGHKLVSDPAHAGYLSAELTKAETALRLGLRYVQDRPLGATTPVTDRSSECEST